MKILLSFALCFLSLTAMATYQPNYWNTNSNPQNGGVGGGSLTNLTDTSLVSSTASNYQWMAYDTNTGHYLPAIKFSQPPAPTPYWQFPFSLFTNPIAIVNGSSAFYGVGTASNTYAGLYQHNYYTFSNTYVDAANQVPAFTWDTNFLTNVFVNVGLQINNAIVGASSTANRDLTQAEWTKANCTASLVITGIDGAANDCSMISNSSASSMATCIYNNTTTYNVKTFSAFIERLAGSGRVWMTANNGTNWIDVSSQIPASGFNRISITTPYTNWFVGFKLEYPGDAIGVDCANATDTDHPSNVCMGRSQSVTTTTMTYTNFYPLVTNGLQFYASVLIKPNSNTNDSTGLGFEFSDPSGSNRLYAKINPYYGAFIIQAFSSNVLTWNSNLPYTNNFLNGQWVKFGVKFGLCQFQILINDQLMATLESSASPFIPDPITMNSLNLIGSGNFFNFQLEELHLNNIVLYGDSYTALPYYSAMFRNNFNPLLYTFHEQGEGGDTTTNELNRLTNNLIPYYNPHANANVVVNLIGTNDGGDNSTTNAALLSLSNVIATAKSTNPWKWYEVSIIPSRGSGFNNGQTSAGFAAFAAGYNNGLVTLTNIDRVIRIDYHPEFQSYLNTPWFNSDELHLTPVGDWLFFQDIQQALQ